MSETMESPAAPQTGAATGTVHCLCCIGRASQLAAPEGAGYELDHPIRCIDEGPLRAVVIEAPAPYLTGAEASERLESVDWLVPRAERHEAIIAAASESGPVIPARFGCVFSGEEPLRQLLAQNEPLLSTALDNVDGASEFAVRILVDREKAVDAMVASDSGDGDGESGGASWMLERRRRRDASREIGPWLAERLREPIESVQGIARAACRHRIVEKQRDGREVIANWAFLVGHEERASFETAVNAAAAALGEIGAEIAFGGPWAPYSFAPSVSAT